MGYPGGTVADPITTAYIESLPKVATARLLRGALFLANGRIYEVIEASNGGFHKAREWRHGEDTDIALVPGSFPSRYLPLVRQGRLLPMMKTRRELMDDGQATCFVFPTEQLARDAAYLDVALILSPGAYVRNQADEPALAVTDGVHLFRLYYFRVTDRGRSTNLVKLSVRPLPWIPRPHTDGPAYWRLLPTWTENTAAVDRTQQTRPLHPPDDDTWPNIRPPSPTSETAR